MGERLANDLFDEIDGEQLLSLFNKDPAVFQKKYGEEGVLRLYSEMNTGVDPFHKYWSINSDNLLKNYNRGKRDFSWAYIEDADFSGFHLEGITLKGAMLYGAKMIGTYLGGADLKGALLPNSDIRTSLFLETDLRWSNLTNADLRYTNFAKADLRGANLTKSDLRYSDLSEALLDFSILTDIAIESNIDLLANDWSTLVIGRERYERDRVDSGKEILPFGMGRSIKNFADERSGLQTKVKNMEKRLLEFENFLKTERGMGKVFLSHSKKDKKIVEKIRNQLEEKGVPTWYDSDQINVGDPILETIKKGIDQSIFVAVFLSSASIESRWVQEELRIAFEKTREAKAKFLPILLENVEIPGYLSGLLYANLQEHSTEQVESVVNKLVRAIKNYNVQQKESMNNKK